MSHGASEHSIWLAPLSRGSAWRTAGARCDVVAVSAAWNTGACGRDSPPTPRLCRSVRPLLRYQVLLADPAATCACSLLPFFPRCRSQGTISETVSEAATAVSEAVFGKPEPTPAENASTKASEAVSAAGEAVSSAGTAVAEAASSAMDSASEAMSSAATSAHEATSSAVSATAEAVAQAADSVSAAARGEDGADE